MDPLSISASIVTLLSATSAIEKGLERPWGLRYAPTNLKTLVNQVTDFTATLKLASFAVEALEQPEQEVLTILKRLLIRAQTELDAIQFYVETQLRKGDDLWDAKNLNLSRRAKVREVFGESQRKLDALRQSLANTKSDLIVALTTINLLHTNSLRSTLLSSIQQIGMTDSALTSSSPAYNQHDRSLGKDASLRDKPPNAKTDVVSQIASIEPHSPSSYLVFRTKLLEKKTCRGPCACRCHVNYKAHTPHWFRGTIGSLFFQFTGTPVWNYRSCDISRCRSHSNTVSVCLEYFFPTWLLPWGISITGGWNDLRGDGSAWTLRIPRILTQKPNQNKMVYALMYGEVPNAERFMRENGIAAIDINDCGVSLFECALFYGRDDMCSMLLDNGVDLATQTRFGVTLGQLAWRVLLSSTQLFESYRNIRASVESAYTIDILQLNPLHKAVIGLNDRDLVEQIKLDPTLVHGRDSESYNPLHWAVKRSDIRTVNILQNGADPNSVCIRGISPLSYAAAWSTPECCQRLLEAGANVRSMDDNGRSPLLWALRTHPVDLNLILLLLRYGADPNNITADSGITCLMESTKYGHSEICEALLNHGADIDSVEQNGWTAIFYAISYNAQAVVKTLIDRGASLIKRDQNGESIIEFAARSASGSTMRHLREAGIQGLSMTDKDINQCWYNFHHQRDEFFSGKRENVDTELAELSALIRSISSKRPVGNDQGHFGLLECDASIDQYKNVIHIKGDGDGNSDAGVPTSTLTSCSFLEREEYVPDELFHDAVETQIQTQGEEAKKNWLPSESTPASQSRGQPWALARWSPG